MEIETTICICETKYDCKIETWERYNWWINKKLEDNTLKMDRNVSCYRFRIKPGEEIDARSRDTSRQVDSSNGLPAVGRAV